MPCYNVRLYDYKHSQQVRIYTKTINTKNEAEKAFAKRKREEEKKEKEEKEIVHERTPEQEEHSIQVSVNRTKQKIFEIVRSNTWHWFVTLTFDRKKIDSSDYDSLVKVTRTWLNHMRTRKCPDFKYFLIPELHADGIHYHFHGLFADCDGLGFTDSGIVQNGKPVYNISGFNFGFTTATKVEDTRRVSSYITKYVTKDLSVHLKNKRRYLASKNCNTADIIDYAMTDDEIKELIAMISDEITFAKTQDCPVAYQKVKYFELKKENMP